MQLDRLNNGEPTITAYIVTWKQKWIIEEKKMYLATYANSEQDIYLDRKEAEKRMEMLKNNL